MNKVTNIRKKVNENNFNLWAREMFSDLVTKRLLDSMPKVYRNLERSDYEEAIKECESIMESLVMWMVPLRNKSQEIKNRKYRRMKAKVIKLRGQK